MWPSLTAASRTADIANIFFIASLVVGVVSTILIVWMSGVKEAYWDEDRRASGERIAELNKEVAAANARAVEAGLALERFKTPRSISEQDAQRAIAELTKFAGNSAAIFILGEGPEPSSLSVAISNILLASGWTAKSWVWSGAGAAAGVLVSSKPESSPEIETASAALVSIFKGAHVLSGRWVWPGDWARAGGTLNGPPLEDAIAIPIRITIGSKPQ
jgi:hypothetical protein